MKTPTPTDQIQPRLCTLHRGAAHDRKLFVARRALRTIADGRHETGDPLLSHEIKQIARDALEETK